MRTQIYRSAVFLLALLLAASSCLATPGRAEAQMRCVGASPLSAPCARAELPAAGLTERQVYAALMPCCRAMRGQCAMTSDRLSHAHSGAMRLVALSARRCLVSIRITAAPTPQAVRRVRWMLTAASALVPPVTAPNYPLPVAVSTPGFWVFSPVLSPHSAPALHGLRAPPVA